MVYMVIGFGVLSIILACTTAYYYAAYKDEESARIHCHDVGKNLVRINDEAIGVAKELLKDLEKAREQRDTYKKELDELKSLTRGKLWVDNRGKLWADQKNTPVRLDEEIVYNDSITHGPDILCKATVACCNDTVNFGPDVLCNNEKVDQP